MVIFYYKYKIHLVHKKATITKQNAFYDELGARLEEDSPTVLIYTYKTYSRRLAGVENLLQSSWFKKINNDKTL